MPAHRPSNPDLLRRALLPGGDPDRLTLARARRLGNPTRRRAAEQAVRRAQYLGRRTSRPTVSARTALGHAPAGTTGPTGSFFAAPADGGAPRLLVGVQVSRAAIHRLARFDSLVGQLTAGRITGAAFSRRVRGWRPIEVLGPPDVAGTYRFVSNPDAVLALAVQAAEEGIETWVDSGRARPLPRLRSTSRRRS